MKRLFRRTVIVALAFAAAGCFPDPKPLIDEFTWQSLDNQDFTEGVSIAAFFRDISFLGQVKTPTLCFSATPTLSVSGSTVTVTVNLVSSGSGTCAQQAGGVLYSGAVRNLSRGTYTVHIISNVQGVGTTEVTETVVL